MRKLGLVVHPTRPIDGPLNEIAAWASAHGLTVGQVPGGAMGRSVADSVPAGDCDLLIAIGGDGTTLSALHAGAESSRPVLPVACGSLGVWTSVMADRVTWALDEIAAGRWSPVPVPDVHWEAADGGVAMNDIALIRDEPGQIVISVTVDDVLYARVAGDGVVVATPMGSSAYSMAAGGPILAPGAEGMSVTPIACHGGSCPPVIAGDGSRVGLAVESGHVSFRYELDGRPASAAGQALTVHHRADYATLVSLEGAEPGLTGLRRRGLIVDSPRVTARLSRSEPLD
jgi:NAD+ kinase